MSAVSITFNVRSFMSQSAKCMDLCQTASPMHVFKSLHVKCNVGVRRVLTITLTKQLPCYRALQLMLLMNIGNGS